MAARTIKGTLALVTGANRGIGRALTEALLARGAQKVYAAARDTRSLAEAQERWGARVVRLPLDVTNPAQVAAAVRAAGDIDLLVNNAGVFEPTDLVDERIVDVARREMEVNYFGTLRMVQSFADVLAHNGGTLVNVGSVVGLSSIPIQPTYSASKAAQHSITQAARAILAGRGVSVHGAYPGPVDTEMTRDLPPQFAKTAPAEVAARILDGIEAGVEDIFPDPFSMGFGEQYHGSPKEAERGMASAVGLAVGA